ncbi:hypothetical protein AN958_01492 [Leucoagaricus sp. SymC.cos]|nr:hypothetical protein AN958_01492 [Leucoagaricus sp. SymC.cos]
MSANAPQTISELRNIEQLRGKDVVILFGKSRAGKSTFINDAYGSSVVESTGSMASDTKVISYVTSPLSSAPRCRDIHDLYLVDTIGLSGSGRDHHRSLLAAKWINIFRLPPAVELDPSNTRSGPLHPTVKGFLYFIDISDEAGLNSDNTMNLQFFKELIGTGSDVLKSVIFVTTKWSKTGESKRKGQERRFKQWERVLQEQFLGSSVIRLDSETSRLDIEDLDESLEENQTPHAKALIAQQKESYADNAFAALGYLVVTPAAAPTQLEREVRTGDGNEMVFSGISIGRLAIQELQEMEKAFREAGQPDIADNVHSFTNQFSNTKVKDAESYVNMVADFIKRVFGNSTEIRNMVFCAVIVVAIGAWLLSLPPDPPLNAAPQIGSIERTLRGASVTAEFGWAFGGRLRLGAKRLIGAGLGVTATVAAVTIGRLQARAAL